MHAASNRRQSSGDPQAFAFPCKLDALLLGDSLFHNVLMASLQPHGEPLSSSSTPSSTTTLLSRVRSSLFASPRSAAAIPPAFTLRVTESDVLVHAVATPCGHCRGCRAALKTPPTGSLRLQRHVLHVAGGLAALLEEQAISDSLPQVQSRSAPRRDAQALRAALAEMAAAHQLDPAELGLVVPHLVNTALDRNPKDAATTTSSSPGLDHSQRSNSSEDKDSAASTRRFSLFGSNPNLRIKTAGTTTTTTTTTTAATILPSPLVAAPSSDSLALSPPAAPTLGSILSGSSSSLNKQATDSSATLLSPTAATATTSSQCRGPNGLAERWRATLQLRQAELASYPPAPTVSDVVAEVVNHQTGQRETVQFINVCLEGGGVWGFIGAGFLWALERKGIRFHSVGGSSVGSILATGLAACDAVTQPKMDSLLAALIHAVDFKKFTTVDESVEPTQEDADKLKVPLDKLRKRWKEAAAMALNAHKLFSAGDEEAAAAAAEAESDGAKDKDSRDTHDDTTSISSSASSRQKNRKAAAGKKPEQTADGDDDKSSTADSEPASPNTQRRKRSGSNSSWRRLHRRSKDEASAAAAASAAFDNAGIDASESESEADLEAESEAEPEAESEASRSFFGRAIGSYFTKLTSATKFLKTLMLVKKKRRQLEDIRDILNKHGGILTGDGLTKAIETGLVDARRRQLCLSLRRSLLPSLNYNNPYMGALPLPAALLPSIPQEDLRAPLGLTSAQLMVLDRELLANEKQLYLAAVAVAKLPAPSPRARLYGDQSPGSASNPLDASGLAAHQQLKDVTRRRQLLIDCIHHRNGLLVDLTTAAVDQRLRDVSKLGFFHRLTRQPLLPLPPLPPPPPSSSSPASPTTSPAPPPHLYLDYPQLRVVALESRTGARVVFPEHAPALVTDARAVPLSEYTCASSSVPLLFATKQQLKEFAFASPCPPEPIIQRAKTDVREGITRVAFDSAAASSASEVEEHNDDVSGSDTDKVASKASRFSRTFSASAATTSAPSAPLTTRTFVKKRLPVPFAGLTPRDLEADEESGRAKLALFRRDMRPVSLTHMPATIAHYWAPLRFRVVAAAGSGSADSLTLPSAASDSAYSTPVSPPPAQLDLGPAESEQLRPHVNQAKVAAFMQQHQSAAIATTSATLSLPTPRLSLNYLGKIPDKIDLVDGGVISNFPFDLFVEPGVATALPTIGFRVGVKRRRVQGFESFFAFIWACLQGLRQYGDGLFFARMPSLDANVREVEEPAGIKFYKFDVTPEEQMLMFNIGVDEALRFLYKQPDVFTPDCDPPKAAFDWALYKLEQDATSLYQHHRRFGLLGGAGGAEVAGQAAASQRLDSPTATAAAGSPGSASPSTAALKGSYV